MMARRSSILRLCQRLASSNEAVINSRPCHVTPIVGQCNMLNQPTTLNCFNTNFRRYKSTKIISDDDFDDARYFEDTEGAEDEDDFFIDPETKRGGFPSQMNRNDSQAEFHSRPLSRSVDPPRRYDSESYRPRRSDNYRSEDSDSFRDQRRGSDSFHDDFRDRRRGIEDLWTELNQKKVDFTDENPFSKDVYTEHPDVANRPKEEDQKFMEKHQITVTGRNKKKPILKFNETSFTDEITVAMKNMKFDQPTPIQSIGWPHALSGNNIVGIAQTGSGKTLSFILPAILHIREQRKRVKNGGPIALVVCPTRELAMQCQEVVRKFSKVCRINSAVVYGGQSKLIQENQLSIPGLDLVIATPGRLLDFLMTDVISLRNCSFVVLDEADRMLDMGFEPQIRSMMGQIRPDRQVLMWSATWPEDIQELASDFLKDYTHVKIGSQENTVNSNISHEFQYCMPHEKQNLLIDHIHSNAGETNHRKCAKTLVFCGTKRECTRLQGILRREGCSVDSLHGDKSQIQRDTVMRNFRSGRISVLVASDVAARGLDVTDIEYVVNYDLPQNIDSYIHRVGRTARAGKKGNAISYFTDEDLDMAGPLIKVLQDVDHDVPDILNQLVQKKSKLRSFRKQDRIRVNPGRGGGRGWSRSSDNFRY